MFRGGARKEWGGVSCSGSGLAVDDCVEGARKAASGDEDRKMTAAADLSAEFTPGAARVGIGRRTFSLFELASHVPVMLQTLYYDVDGTWRLGGSGRSPLLVDSPFMGSKSRRRDFGRVDE